MHVDENCSGCSASTPRGGAPPRQGHVVFRLQPGPHLMLLPPQPSHAHTPRRLSAATNLHTWCGEWQSIQGKRATASSPFTVATASPFWPCPALRARPCRRVRARVRGVMLGKRTTQTLSAACHSSCRPQYERFFCHRTALRANTTSIHADSGRKSGWHLQHGGVITDLGSAHGGNSRTPRPLGSSQVAHAATAAV